MTSKELFNCHPDKLAKLTDDELREIFAPYFSVTRVDDAKRRVVADRSAAGKKAIVTKTKKQLLDEKLKALGI